jgi:hypothetical protein
MSNKDNNHDEAFAAIVSNWDSPTAEEPTEADREAARSKRELEEARAAREAENLEGSRATKARAQERAQGLGRDRERRIAQDQAVLERRAQVPRTKVPKDLRPAKVKAAKPVKPKSDTGSKIAEFLIGALIVLALCKLIPWAVYGMEHNSLPFQSGASACVHTDWSSAKVWQPGC